MTTLIDFLNSWSILILTIYGCLAYTVKIIIREYRRYKQQKAYDDAIESGKLIDVPIKKENENDINSDITKSLLRSIEYKGSGRTVFNLFPPSTWNVKLNGNYKEQIICKINTLSSKMSSSYGHLTVCMTPSTKMLFDGIDFTSCKGVKYVFIDEDLPEYDIWIIDKHRKMSAKVEVSI